MRNKFYSLLILLLLPILGKSQAWEGIGAKNINIGYSLYNINDAGKGVVATYDYGISDVISVGLGIENNFDSGNNYIELRADYHFQHALRLDSYFDVYAGLDIGYNTALDNNIGYGGHIGLRLSLWHYFGIYTEVGSRANFGLFLNI